MRELPPINHRAHLGRLALEVLQLGLIVASVVLIADDGLSLRSGLSGVATAVVTIVLLRSPRPTLPGFRG